MDRTAHVRGHSSPMVPLPPVDAVPVLPGPLRGIRSIVFDLYGTLMISAAGDVSHSREVTDQAGMEAVLRHLQAQQVLSTPTENTTIILANRYRNILTAHSRKRKDEGADHPEIDIREVFDEVLEDLVPTAQRNRTLVEDCVIVFECVVNPTWPMPGSTEVLESLLPRFVPGILSNAQFYTPIVFEGLYGKTPADFGFRQEHVLYSYQHRLGKPSPVLFDTMRQRLENNGIAPREVLYIGNDLIKDILPARAAGFRNALFAGDQRSLRIAGRSWAEVRELTDAVITDWTQLESLL